MDIDALREQTCAQLFLIAPDLQSGVGQLVDECLASAQVSFKTEFLLRLSPQAWARIALLYARSFVDTGADVSVGEIAATVLRDSIQINRMDMLVMDLAQRKAGETQERGAARDGQRRPPSLSLVRADTPQK